MPKTCRYCMKTFDDDQFRKNRRKCKICERSHGRQYRRSEHGKSKSRKWSIENKKRHANLQAKWYRKNKKKINEKFVNRYHNDHKFRLQRDIRKHVAQRLKSRKKGPIKYINCEKSFYINWLTFCFAEGMTMNNHGDIWHQDHVIPCAQFNTIDKNGNKDEHQIRLCYSWFNVMPLSQKDNLCKHERIDVSQLKTHLDNLMNFTSEYGGHVDDEYICLCATYLDAGNS